MVGLPISQFTSQYFQSYGVPQKSALKKGPERQQTLVEQTKADFVEDSKKKDFTNLNQELDSLQQQILQLEKAGFEQKRKDRQSAKYQMNINNNITPRGQQSSNAIFNSQRRTNFERMRTMPVKKKLENGNYEMNESVVESDLNSSMMSYKDQKKGVMSRFASIFKSKKGKMSESRKDQSFCEDYLDETDPEEYAEHASLSEFNDKQKNERMRYLWAKAFAKAKGAIIIINRFQGMETKIKLFGVQQLVDKKNLELEMQQQKQQKNPLILLPNTRFKIVWNLIIVFLLLYTATYVPYRVSFIDGPPTLGFQIFENTIDGLFFCDIIVNFLSAIEKKDGSYECSFKVIAKTYVKSWFFLDLLATIPTQLFEINTNGDGNASNVNKLLRLARLPRLYRLLRILRLIKIFKILQHNAFIQSITDKIKLNAGVTRMIFTLIFAFFSVHLISCFWFLAAKFDDLNPNTWVARLGHQDESPQNLYLECIYWSLQTVATVGYGDFGAETVPELILSLIWMVFGVGFYSFVIGNMTSIIANESANSENLYNKLKSLEEFARKTKLPQQLHYKIRQFLENNYGELFSRVDEEQLLQELPSTLREEVLYFRFGALVDQIDFLKKNSDKDYVWAMVQVLKKIKVDKDDVIYWEQDFSEEIFFIKTGKVKLFAKNGYPFMTFKERQFFGDYDVIFREPRDGKAVAQQDCIFYTLHRDHLLQLFDQYPELKEEMEKEAEQKKKQQRERKSQFENKNPLFGKGNYVGTADMFKQSKQQKFGFNARNSDNRTQSRIDETGKNRDSLKSDSQTQTFLHKETNQELSNSQSSCTLSPNYNQQESIRLNLKRDSVYSLTSAGESIIDKTKGKSIKRSASQIAKKKQRYEDMVRNADGEPDFTKSVFQILHGKTVRESKDDTMVKKGELKNLPLHLQIQQLKEQFKQKNKISTMDSYEKKTNFISATFKMQNEPSLNQIIEEDKDLGDEDEEEGLENIARFNDDMSLIALNVYQINNLFDLVCKENEEIIDWVQSLETQAVTVEDRQLELEKKMEQILESLN